MEKFQIIKESTTHVRRFNLRGRKIEFKIRTIPEDKEPTEWIRGAVNEAVEYCMTNLSLDDKIGITFCGKSFEERGPGYITFRSVQDLKLDDVWEMISKIFQSNSEGINTDSFCLAITSVRLPKGKGRGKKYNTFDEECAARKGIITINNDDNLCLPRALVVAIAHTEKDKNYIKIRKDVKKIQFEKAAELINNAKINIPPEGSGVPELLNFQNYLRNYKITVYKYNSRGRDVIFKGDNEGKSINLLHHNGHYNVITSLTAAFCCSYYCELCHISYNTKNSHRCGGTCPQCQKSPKCATDAANILCNECNRYFRGSGCFENHKTSAKGKSLCTEIKRCTMCLKTIRRDREHQCGEYFCKICDKYVAGEHLCYMRRNMQNPKTENTLYIFYDLECRQEKYVDDKKIENESIGEINQHEPCLCVFEQRCERCMNSENVNICEKCGVRQNILKRDIINNFVEFILNQRKLFKNVIVIAHNGQSYDHQFILKHILENTVLKPFLIMRGTKIVLMTIENVKFLDSLNYFPMALTKLPKAMDLPPLFKKGYFPHYFNTSSNENYIGKLPSIEFYSPDTMNEEQRSEFIKWYEEHKNDEFNMQKDMVEYCISDVQILLQACLKFRELFLKECNVEPFLEATTIASACNLVYRRNFLKADTIGIIPQKGYRYCDIQSKEAVKWLILEEKKRGLNIQHAAKGREAVVAGVKVDGFCSETEQVFEFHGCYYHGHINCLHHIRDEKLHNDPEDTVNQRYNRTIEKTNRLRNLGYQVIEMWECEFKRSITNEERKYVESHVLLNYLPLNPRDAFYGGRTGNLYNYYKCKSGEKIKYIDVCSLYPYVCKYGKFPVGHPKIHLKNSMNSNMDIKNMNGVIKCKILPPEQLFHPVLPVKQNNKLMFSLCRTCSELKNQEICSYTNEERALIGTWIIDEVLKAIEKGYKMLEIFEIWEYKISQFNKETKAEGLFTEMMNKFIKMKQQASGWPSKCATQVEKEKYIDDFLNKEGIKLNFSEICSNPGQRSLAKLILNSFWGKFGQEENMDQTCVLNDPSEQYRMVTDPHIYVNNILPINENNIVVNWIYKEEAIFPMPTVNVCLAGYTTAQARLKLYSYLEHLGERVLYYDTDSVIYISREGEFEPETGDFIGDMTDELECYGVGSYITEFVSGGPKNYSYKVYSTKDNNEKVVCKVKGICLNYQNAQKINFNSIKQAVLNSENNSIQVIYNNIRRTKYHDVLTTPEIKTYKPRAEKRKFLGDGSSEPYGYKKVQTQCS